MRPATLISVVLFCLAGAAMPALSAPAARNAPPTPRTAPAPQPADDDDDAAPAAPAAARSGPAQPVARASDRRRRSYASCNRDSHRRNLRGGARRRFLIRCKLGYEKRQPGKPAEPSPQGKRP